MRGFSNRWPRPEGQTSWSLVCVYPCLALNTSSIVSSTADHVQGDGFNYNGLPLFLISQVRLGSGIHEGELWSIRKNKEVSNLLRSNRATRNVSHQIRRQFIQLIFV